ncbi:hypothetical protein K458DRAFT_402164 [Lentithecium fluviatile CBS 122367]|uniref:PH domain-containing protein n=1 Tax=Lentithecium fluviatile CBS 122367 TaxID=1168545 RepID=A0A6G1J824_9PLEO|nr:hypothetical protein K458DRAFT_402164 [Lentithecium fluviatile CBS 122367]
MSAAVEQKPVVAPEASTVEPVAPVAAPAEPVVPATEEKPAEAAVEPKAEETPKVEGEAAAAAPAEEKKEEKPVEPIYSGALGYKAPGLKNVFRYSKKYFWFGEEAAVPTSSLTHYLRGEKAEVANPTAAWSSVTGKGLVFFAKHADQKETPAGVLNLADATELSKDGTIAFHFKLHGGKHSFEAQNSVERNGWYVAFEKAIEEATAAKEGIVSSESYKEELEKLRKPATLAAPATGSTPKKSTEVAPKPAEGETSAAAAETAPARAGSSSSSSSDEEKKKKKAKSKSRSASRGKRSSIFGTFLGKKDKVEEKVEEKKTEKAEEKEEKKAEKEGETPAVVAEPSTAAPVTAPVVTEEAGKPTEETKAAVVPEEKKEEKPKPVKRGSIFGNFVEKLKSPTHEKKEADLVPPPKEPEPVSAEAPKLDELPKSEETPAAAPVEPVAPATDGTTEAPKTEEVKPAETKTPTTPAKEKQHFSFGKFLGSHKEKVKSPSTEKAPEAPKTEEAPKVEETPAPVAPVEPVAETPVETKEEKKEEPAAEASTATKKRGSIFGALGGSVKKEKDGEEKPQGLKGLFRNASKAGKSKKEKEVAAPAKVEEAAEPKEEKTEAAPAEEKKEPEAPAVPAEQAAIGDVVPDAVTVGQAPKSTPQVASTA